ncbi:MAG TPA: hypothetical protein VFE01_06540 [Terracidiphilus sp.]|jgi:hypothetical protein|nr:hypothetical protein [Terracidiphilus sp.]
MHRRTRRTLLIVAGVLVFLALAIFLRSKAPPEAARLLPESDGIVYIDIKPFRVFLRKDLKPPQRVPEYQQFVDATGIDWERDLDQVAVALHRMPDPNGPNGPVAYSLVLVGRLTGKRLNTWLDSHATSREIYAGKTIYNVPSEGRTVRVAQIGYDMLAVSNTPTPEQIHSIIDRHRTAALPFAGSTLLSHHYHEVPLLALAWGVGQIGLPFSESGAITIFGFSLPLQDGATIVASLTPSLPLAGSLRLRVEEIAPTDQQAASQAAALNSLVAIARGYTAPLPSNPANNGLKQLLSTAEITQKHDRVLVTATFSPSLVVSASGSEKDPAGEITAPPQSASNVK